MELFFLKPNITLHDLISTILIAEVMVEPYPYVTSPLGHCLTVWCSAFPHFYVRLRGLPRGYTALFQQRAFHFCVCHNYVLSPCRPLSLSQGLHDEEFIISLFSTGCVCLSHTWKMIWQWMRCGTSQSLERSCHALNGFVHSVFITLCDGQSQCWLLCYLALPMVCIRKEAIVASLLCISFTLTNILDSATSSTPWEIEPPVGLHILLGKPFVPLRTHLEQSIEWYAGPCMWEGKKFIFVNRFKVFWKKSFKPQLDRVVIQEPVKPTPP